MAKTTAGSDAEDHVVDHVESTDGTATAESVPTKRGRFGRRNKSEKTDSAGSGTGTVADEPGKSGKTGAAGKAAAEVGSKAKAGKASKSEKAGKPARTGTALSGAARLARVVTVLGLIAVLLAVLLVVQLVRGAGGTAARAAQEDRKEAARSQAEISVARLFSFDYKTLDADFAAQRAQATGDFVGEIDKVTNPAVRPLATKEHVVVQAVSVASATVDDPGPDVQVIVFLNQAVTLDLLPAPRLDRQRLLVSMRLVDNQWKVAGVKAL